MLSALAAGEVLAPSASSVFAWLSLSLAVGLSIALVLLVSQARVHRALGQSDRERR